MPTPALPCRYSRQTFNRRTVTAVSLLPDVSKEPRIHPQRVVFEPEDETSEINNLALQGTESLKYFEFLRRITIWGEGGTENT